MDSGIGTFVDRAVQLLDLPDGQPALADIRAFYAAGAVGSTGGAVRCMHVPLTPEGRPGAGFEYQPSIVDEALNAARLATGLVVELGCGEGFNTLRLAHAHPELRFLGLDLLPEHAARAAGAGTPNAGYAAADFAHLPLAPGSVDLAFSVESLAHALDTSAALAAVRTALSAGGRLVAIELFRTAEFDALPVELQHAGTVVEALIAVPPLHTLPGWLDLAARAGLRQVGTRDLTGAALPMLTRLSRRAERAADGSREMLTSVLTCHTLRHGAHGLHAVELVTDSG
jgi:SAM-dependent methyltransferase